MASGQLVAAACAAEAAQRGRRRGLRGLSGSGWLCATALQFGGARLEGLAEVAIGTSVEQGRSSAEVQRLGLAKDAVVQIVGWDDDCDEAFLDAVEQRVQEVVIGETGDVVDAVLIWWRDDDPDLADGLLDALAMLADDGTVWLVAPRPGRPGHMTASDVKEAVQVAGLQITSSISVGADWQAARLTAPKSGR